MRSPHFSFWITSFLCISRGYQTEVYRMDDKIICYMAAMAIAGRMLDSGTITRREFLVFEEKMRLKYELPKCSLYRDFHLLYQPDQR